MSIIDRAKWKNPFTGQGLRLPHGIQTSNFQIHEVGLMLLDDHWQHHAVCSPFWRLFYEFSAGAWVECNGKRIELNSDSAVLLPEGLVFDCGGETGVEHMWLHFSMHMSKTPTLPKMLVIAAGADFRGVATTLQSATKQGKADSAHHLSMALLHMAFAGFAPGWFEAPSPRLQRVFTWLEQNIGNSINNEQLAAKEGFGVEAFIRWFKSHTGRTPAAYVAEQRVQEAGRRLALSDDSIENIAEGVGFSNRHHFSRVFSRHAGCGPAAFRRGGRRG